MLEWYAPGLGLDGLMEETEQLLRSVLPARVGHGGVTTEIAAPFERLTMAEAFRAHCNGLDILATVDPVTAEGDAEALYAAARAAGLALPPGCLPEVDWQCFMTFSKSKRCIVWRQSTCSRSRSNSAQPHPVCKPPHALT